VPAEAYQPPVFFQKINEFTVAIFRGGGVSLRFGFWFWRTFGGLIWPTDFKLFPQ